MANQSKYKINKRNKYLEALGAVEHSFNWIDDDDSRWPYWNKQIDQYGFADYETWNLNDAFIEWFYSRLKMFDEVNIIGTTSEFETRYQVYNEIWNLQQCVDYMIQELEKYIVGDIEHRSSLLPDKFWEVLKSCFEALWW